MQPGILRYCHIHGKTTCCFYNESCSTDYYKSVHQPMEQKSEYFLRFPEIFLELMVQNLGYDTCHRIQGINASICAKDCEELKKTDFARDCKKNNGLLKCCIR